MGNSRQGKENVSPKLAKRCASIDRIGLDSVKEGGAGMVWGKEVRIAAQELGASIYR